MPVAKYKVLRNICKAFSITPCKLNKLLVKNNVTTSEQLIKVVNEQLGMVMADHTAKYIILEREYIR
jgi:hypothetical protein